MQTPYRPSVRLSMLGSVLHMDVSVYVCINKCLCSIYASRMLVCSCECTSVWMRACPHVCACVCARANAHVRTFERVFVCALACMHVCVYSCLYVHICASVRAWAIMRYGTCVRPDYSLFLTSYFLFLTCVTNVCMLT